MSLLSQAAALTVTERNAGARQAIRTFEIPIEDLPTFAEKLEAEFPSLTLNQNAITKSGVSPLGDGGPIVPYAVKSRVPKGAATVYYNGKVVLAGALADFSYPG